MSSKRKDVIYLYVCFEQAVKVDIGMEVDVGTALNISQDDCPQLIFIKNGKALHKLEGTFSVLLKNVSQPFNDCWFAGSGDDNLYEPPTSVDIIFYLVDDIELYLAQPVKKRK